MKYKEYLVFRTGIENLVSWCNSTLSLRQAKALQNAIERRIPDIIEYYYVGTLTGDRIYAEITKTDFMQQLHARREDYK